MDEYGNFIRRADLIKNLIDREKLAEDAKKPNRSVQDANKKRWLLRQEQMRHELAAQIAAAAATGGPVPPSLHFANGEKGVWFDASDLTTLFQDAAGTIPVTAAGQKVGKWLDKSGNGNHAVQATLANQPTYQIDADGYPNVTFIRSGTTQLVTPSINFTSTAQLTVCIGLNVLESGSAGVAIELGTTVASVDGSFSIGAPSSTADHSVNLRGTSTVNARVSNIVDGDDIITGLFDLSQATRELQVIPHLNYVQIPDAQITWTGTTAGGGNFSNLPLYIGAEGASKTLPFGGKIYQIIVRGAASTGTLVRQFEEWVDSKSGE